MTAFAKRVADLLHVPPERLKRLAGGDLSEVLLISRSDARCTVAKGGPAVAVEAAMLRFLAGAGIPVPTVEGEFDGLLLLEHVENDSVFSPRSWADIGTVLKRLHTMEGGRFGWSADYALGTVTLDNRRRDDWRAFWFEQRLASTAALLDRPWRERIAGLEAKLTHLLPARPPASLLHGDLWPGNILVSAGKLAALIDPACYHGHSEVDLAMLTLFDSPPADFWAAYGEPETGWEERRDAYQLFPALVHLRLFGPPYEALVERLLARLEAN